MTTTDDLAALLAAATPGPWVFKHSYCSRDIGIMADGGCIAECFDQIRRENERAAVEQAANAALIALAPTLAAEVLDLRAKLAEAETALAYAADELDAYYKAEYPSDHPYHVHKLAQAKEANPARAALAKIREGRE